MALTQTHGPDNECKTLTQLVLGFERPTNRTDQRLTQTNGVTNFVWLRPENRVSSNTDMDTRDDKHGLSKARRHIECHQTLTLTQGLTNFG